MSDLLLLLVGLSTGIAFTYFIMSARIVDARANSREWMRYAMQLQEELDHEIEATK